MRYRTRFLQPLGGLCFFSGRVRGLGGQEQHCEHCAHGSNAAGDEGADGEAAQEGVSRRVLQCLSKYRAAESRDPAGGYVRGAHGLVRDRRDAAGHAGRQR